MKIVARFALFFSPLLLAADSPAQQTFSLRTADTVLRVQAAPSAPAVLDLATSDGTVWTNRLPESLPASVELAGKLLPLSWIWNSAASHADSRGISLVYDSASPHLRLTWLWEAPQSFGPLEHRIRVENLDVSELWLPFLDSVRFDFVVPDSLSLLQAFVEKGAGTPSPEGTHILPVSLDSHWIGYSSTYAHVENGGPREIIPWLYVSRADAAQSAWYIGIEFSGRTRLALDRAAASLRVAAGLNPEPSPFRTRLLPGSPFETPAIFIGGSVGGLDAAGNVLRPWIRHTLGNPVAWNDPRYPNLVNNSWGSGLAIDEALALRMLRDSAELKFEMFHMDAGWFRGVGDWVPDAQKFPRGLAPIAAEAHRLGMKFGLWVDWTQAALGTEPGALNVRDPKISDWVVAATPAEWKPEPFKGQTLDIGLPPAKQWALAETERLVRDFHLDMLEHDGYLVAQGCDRADHPHAPPVPSQTRIVPLASSFLVEGPNSTDVSYGATRAYYDVQSALRKNHPGLLLEICNDGGRMVDFGSAAHGDYFSITDTYDPLSNRRAFFDASHVLPAAMLECYVEKWPTPHLENFRYMLRSGMMGWFTVMLDTTSWTPAQREAARREFELYKSELRPFIRDASLFHISDRPDGIHWDAIEYFDSTRKHGVVYAFRGSTETEPGHIFFFQGLDPARSYELHFQDASSPDRTVSGRELLSTGLRVDLPLPNSSELIFFREAN